MEEGKITWHLFRVGFWHFPLKYLVLRRTRDRTLDWWNLALIWYGSSCILWWQCKGTKSVQDPNNKNWVWEGEHGWVWLRIYNWSCLKLASITLLFEVAIGIFQRNKPDEALWWTKSEFWKCIIGIILGIKKYAFLNNAKIFPNDPFPSFFFEVLQNRLFFILFLLPLKSY